MNKHILEAQHASQLNNTYTMRRRDLIAGYPQTLVPATGDMLITAGMSFKTLPFVRQLSTPCAAHPAVTVHCTTWIVIIFTENGWTTYQCFYHLKQAVFDLSSKSPQIMTNIRRSEAQFAKKRPSKQGIKSGFHSMIAYICNFSPILYPALIARHRPCFLRRASGIFGPGH